MSVHTLRYDGEEFAISKQDERRLRALYDAGLAITPQVFTFTPAGDDTPVTISIGGSVPFALVEDAPAS